MVSCISRGGVLSTYTECCSVHLLSIAKGGVARRLAPVTDDLRDCRCNCVRIDDAVDREGLEEVHDVVRIANGIEEKPDVGEHDILKRQWDTGCISPVRWLGIQNGVKSTHGTGTNLSVFLESFFSCSCVRESCASLMRKTPSRALVNKSGTELPKLSWSVS